jgi:hypothetical protein
MMFRRRFLTLAAVVMFGGCSNPPASSLPTKHPNQFTKAELEADIGQRLKLTDVTLTEGEKGKYTGTGKGADGMTYEVKVTVTDRSMSWEKLYTKNGEVKTEGGSVDW